MNHNFCYTVPAFIFLLITSSNYTSATHPDFFHIKPQGEKTMKLDIISGESSTVHRPETVDWFNEVMGIEECESGDEECFKRRVLVDAHLDYIYTQHHKH